MRSHQTEMSTLEYLYIIVIERWNFIKRHQCQTLYLGIIYYHRYTASSSSSYFTRDR